jgi:hypothetical protein
VKVSAWHGGQLLVAWGAGLFIATLLLGSLNAWEAQFNRRWELAESTIEMAQQENFKTTESGERSQKAFFTTDSIWGAASMALMRETGDHNRVRSILKPAVFVIAIFVIPAVLLTWSWQWFGAHPPSKL